MEYSIRELSELAGVSARTLRYYDEIGLLAPLYVNDAGYRYYGEKELELLQQILFYRERGFSLQQISRILYQQEFDVLSALQEHLSELEEQRCRIERLISSVNLTIASMKGECEMSDKERFEAFKKKLVNENEERYGNEVREKYGDEEMDASNRKLLNMTEEDYERFQNLGKEIIKRLEEAVKAGEDPEGECGRRIVVLHKEWLGMTWKKYTEEAHKGIANMYIADEQFKCYYDKETPGCAEFLRRAVTSWVERI